MENCGLLANPIVYFNEESLEMGKGKKEYKKWALT